ncbi:MAG: hypothetical protein ETSY2_26840 [Candidatus Entotheonella gemina]|uniref:Uncharacterized protein n=1 Tax=Candidatus Entotheonella gemina TaxID=1429439 RepID=W4M4E1_9BACT|nr:MAG: hypothetical protein ETSY2_26840 [Candidatus Entotheonella gemina]
MGLLGRSTGDRDGAVVVWGGLVMLAAEPIPQDERPTWLERAKQKLREQGTPWLEACVPVVRSLAFKLRGLGIPVYPEAETALGR